MLSKTEIFKNFDQNEVFRKSSPKSLLFKSFDQNGDFFENFALNRYFRKFDQNWCISKILTKIRFSKILTKIAIFLNFRQHRDISKILTSIKIFQTSWQKSRHFEHLHQDRDFQRFWPKSVFIENFDQNPDFSKVWHKLRFFEHLTKIDMIWKFWPKLTFSKILIKKNQNISKIFTKIEIFKDFDQKSLFFENFAQNPDFFKVWHKWDFLKNWPKLGWIENFDQNCDFSKILWKSSPKLRFSKILTNIAIFLNFGQNRDIWKTLTSIKIYHQFWPKSLFFLKLVQNRDVSNKMEIFRGFWPKLEFLTILTKIDIFKDIDEIPYFSKIWPKSGFFESLK